MRLRGHRIRVIIHCNLYFETKMAELLVAALKVRLKDTFPAQSKITKPLMFYAAKCFLLFLLERRF